MSTTDTYSPDHYTAGNIETIYAIENALGPEGFRAFCMGNWIKYNARHKHKRGERDLKAAEQYLTWAVNGLPKPVDGKLPKAAEQRKFKIGDVIYSVNEPDKHYEVVDLTVTNYRLKSGERFHDGIPFSYEDKWEVVKQRKFKIGDTIRKAYTGCLRPTEYKVVEIKENGYAIETYNIRTYVNFAHEGEWELVK